MSQIGLGIIAFIVIVIVLVILYYKRKGERPDLEYENDWSFSKLLDLVKVSIVETVKDDDDVYIGNDIQYEAIMRSKLRLRKCLNDATYGIAEARNTVIALIRSIVEQHITEYELACQVLGSSSVFYLQPNIKWEVLLYKLQKVHGKDVIEYLESKYNISADRIVADGTDVENVPRPIFDFKLLDYIFSLEITEETLTLPEALDVISIILYTRYKGFGVVDTLLQLNIDGMNFGTSGSCRYMIDGKFDIPYKMTNSVWIQVNAKWVMLEFIDFNTEGEMKRVINQITSYGVSSPMTEKKSQKVTELPDGSRVTALRKPTSECWAVFIRKFVLKSVTLDFLINKPNYNNCRVVIDLIDILMHTDESVAFTGQQNTGKTTLMCAAIGHTDICNIRVLEMSFELALRERYPSRNILTVKPSDYISSSQLQDILKKTDAYISMVGEVAEDIVAARAMQFGLVGASRTYLSHHGKDDIGLVYGLANSLVACGEYEDHNVAVNTVCDVIKHNIHLGFNGNERCIEYISEIVKLDEISPYPEVGESGAVASAIDQYTTVAREFFTRTTDRVKFMSRKIIVFDKVTKTYKPTEFYTKETFDRMLNKMSPDYRERFIKLFLDNWRDEKRGVV